MKRNSKICLALALSVLLVVALACAACQGGKYKLTFETNGGEAIQPISFNKGAKITPPTATKAYFTFVGWYEDEKLTTPFEQFGKMPDRDVTVYAKWTPSESGKIIFQSNGGSEVEEITGIVGQTVTQPANPTKEGYVFAGWYRDANLENLYVFGTFESGTTTLYAKWSKDTASYKYVTFVLDGATTEVPVIIGHKVAEPTQNQDVECVWYEDDGFTTEYDFDLEVNADLTLYGLRYSKGLAFDGGAVVGYDGSSNQIFVPSKHNGATITTIGQGAFAANTSINYVLLPETVTTVEQTAFYGCEYLVNVNVTSHVTEIGKLAFANCFRMTAEIDLGGLTVLGDNAFANCSFLTSVHFGNKLVQIGESAFANCTMLEKADLADSVETISDFAFANSGITSLKVPASLSAWGKGVVKGCSNLTTLSGGNANFVLDTQKGTLTNDSRLVLYYETEGNKQIDTFTLAQDASIEPYAFFGNTTVKHLDASNSAQALSLASLEGIKALQTLKARDLDANNPYLAYWFGAATAQSNTSGGLYVLESLQKVQFTAYSSSEIADYAFYGCNGLATVEGVENATQIGNFAFAYTAVSSFKVESGVQSVAPTAFYRAAKLTDITVDENNANYLSHDGALYGKTDGLKLLYVPETKTSIEFATGTTEIGEGALYHSQIAELTVPTSVEKIGFGAFDGMGSLRKLTVPFIGGSADDNTYMLYVFGAEVTTSSNGAPTSSLDKCPGMLESITISGKVTSIPDFAFAFCSTVSEIACGNDYDSIGIGAFCGTAITSVTVPDTVTTVAEYAYYTCEDVEKIVVGSSVTSIGKWAFAGIEAVTSIVFKEGESDLTIGEAAFLAYSYLDSSRQLYASSELSELKLSNNVVSIGRNAFAYVGCDGLIGNGNTLLVNSPATKTFLDVVFDVEHSRLTELGDEAFVASGVYTVVLPASLQTIGNGAFAVCAALSKVTIGSEKCEATALVNIGDEAFAGATRLESFTLYKSAASANDVPILGSGALSNVTVYVPQGSGRWYRSKWLQAVSTNNIVIAEMEAAQ